MGEKNLFLFTTQDVYLDEKAYNMADTCADLWTRYLDQYQQQIDFWPPSYGDILERDPLLNVSVASLFDAQIASAQKDFDQYTYVPNIRHFREHGLDRAFIQDGFYNEGFAWSDSFYQIDTYFLTRPPYNNFTFLANYGELPNRLVLKRSVVIKLLPKFVSVVGELTESDRSSVLKRHKLFEKKFLR